MTDVVRCAVDGSVAVVTLDRPEVRNAINVDLQRQLWHVIEEIGDDGAVGGIVLTGADPAFCAGVDLRELATTIVSHSPANTYRYIPPITKPIVAAINGSCVTGGLELALQCSFMVASERARFADTHARVGVMPGGGMAVQLAQAVGFRRAREMSLTGNYIDALEARQIGLVNHVVPHEHLVPFAVGLVRDMAEGDSMAVSYLLRTYDEVAAQSTVQGAEVEQRRWQGWQIDGAEISRRRTGIVARGRHQIE